MGSSEWTFQFWGKIKNHTRQDLMSMEHVWVSVFVFQQKTAGPKSLCVSLCFFMFTFVVKIFLFLCPYSAPLLSFCYLNDELFNNYQMISVGFWQWCVSIERIVLLDLSIVWCLKKQTKLKN
jgi:hypothetical protein